MHPLKSGLLGVYRGFSVALIGVVAFRSLYMGGYDSIKLLLHLDPDRVP